MSIVRIALRPPSARATAPAISAAAPFGYSPVNLRSAYRLARAALTKGGGETVAIVDAHSDPRAASDLARYRSQYHLPRCSAIGHCLRIVNELGRARPLPTANAGWGFEESLDLDMVSAICPRCHILLIEARTANLLDMATAEDTAARMGVRFISNSWNISEFDGEQAFDPYFNHPGTAITFAAGDMGYGTAYPTDTQYVTAVGGTTLRHARNGRGWSEAAWSGTGSGCSTYAAKASWQLADDTAPNGCLNRTGNDVAADAALSTGVSVFDSYRTGGTWLEAGGTSVATPIIAAIYALAGKPAPGSYPAQYPYQHRAHFYDVTSGRDGRCEPHRQYLCRAAAGYDGPTGLGSPNGTAGFAKTRTRQVMLVDPGTQDARPGAAFSLRITGLDANSSAKSLTYSAHGTLPPGLSIVSRARSTDGFITGTLPASPTTTTVRITATDGATHQRGSVTFRIVTVPSLSGAAATGAVPIASYGCLDNNGGAPGAAVIVTDFCVDPPTPTKTWAYVAAGSPGGAGELTSAGECLGLSGSRGVLKSCTGAAVSDWLYLGFGLLENPATGKCLAIPGAPHPSVQVRLAPCTGSSLQIWQLPNGLITSGTGKGCVSGTQFGAQVKLQTCNTGLPGQQWSSNNVGWLTPAIGGPACLGPNNNSSLDGAAAVIVDCDTSPDPDIVWFIGPGGELVNSASGKCLTDPGSGRRGTGLVQEDCYGDSNEIWAIN